MQGAFPADNTIFLHINEDMRDATWTKFLGFALDTCRYVLLVHSMSIPEDNRATVLAALEPSIIEESTRSRWPGTVLGKVVQDLIVWAPGVSESAGATVYQCHFNATTKDALLSVADGLFDWSAPTLFEDLALLREDCSVFFGSVTHEQYAFLRVTPQEYSALLSAVPEIATMVQNDGG
jgi:hypothetical protein